MTGPGSPAGPGPEEVVVVRLPLADRTRPIPERAGWLTLGAQLLRQLPEQGTAPVPERTEGRPS